MDSHQYRCYCGGSWFAAHPWNGGLKIYQGKPHQSPKRCICPCATSHPFTHSHLYSLDIPKSYITDQKKGPPDEEFRERKADGIPLKYPEVCYHIAESAMR